MEQANIQKDQENLEKIKDFFMQFEESKKEGKTAKLQIKIKANEKVWETEFNLYDKDGITVIENQSKCISIKIGNKLYTSTLKKNNTSPYCFKPQLQSSKEITTTDILQVLQMKLTLAHPLSKGQILNIEDTATIEGVRMSPYRLLRGEKPFYEKYGFYNIDMEIIKDQISKMKVKDVGEELIETNGNEELSLIDYMKSIDFETEKKEKISTYIFDSILEKLGLYPDLFFIFDSKSHSWKSWNEKISIVEATYEEFPLEGGGKHRKRTQTKKKRSLLLVFSRKKTNTKSNDKRNRTKKKKTMS